MTAAASLFAPRPATTTRARPCRLRRAVVHRTRARRRRRHAGRAGAHRLSRRAAEIRVAEGVSLPKDDRLVRRHLVHYPLRRGELFNLIAVFHSATTRKGGTPTASGPLHQLLRGEIRTGRTLLQNVNA